MTSRFAFLLSGSHRLKPRNLSPSIAIAPSNPSDKTPQNRALRSSPIAHEILPIFTQRVTCWTSQG